LQGYVEDGERVLPCRDTYIRNCYCNEYRVTLAHEDGLATSGSLGDGELKVRLEEKAEDPVAGTAGAIVEAHYRPLVTAWLHRDDPKPKHGDDWQKYNPPPTRETAFDWMEPKFTPGAIQLPWPEGLFVNAISKDLFLGEQLSTGKVPGAVGQPIKIPTQRFTIRRILVAAPPWDAIRQCMNAVNESPFPGPNHKATFDKEKNPNGIPNFPQHTVQFTGADIDPMMDSGGNRWFEIVLHFEAIERYTKNLYGFDGKANKGWVTWNHLLMMPSWLWSKADTGWYSVFLGKERKLAGINIQGLLGADLTEGDLFPEANLKKLFEN